MAYWAGRLERDFSLLQHPDFDLIVPHPEHVERSAPIVLLSQRRRLVPLDLCHHANRDFNPFRQCAKRAP